VCEQYVSNESPWYGESLLESLDVMSIRTRDGDDGPLVAAVDETACAVLGYDRDDLVGRRLATLYADASPEGDLLAAGGSETDDGLLAAGGSETDTRVRAAVRPFRTRDGDEVLALVRTVPYRDGSGEITGTHATCIVVTAWAKQASRFEALVEHSSDLITVVDAEGTIRYESRSVEHLLGWAPDELVGTSGFEYVHPDDRDALADALSRLAAGQVSQSTVRYRFRHADGSWRWIESVLTTAPPAVDGAFVVNSRDVTERMLVDHHVQVLDRVFRHNFRNALNVVVGHADLLAETLEGEPARAARMVADRGRELDSLADTARRIGQYARPAGSTERVEVGRLLDRVAHDLSEEFDAGAIQFDEVARDLTVTARLEAAVQEVCHNAVKHGSADEPATVSVRQCDGSDRISFEIADRGPGIPDQERRVLEAGHESPLRHGSGLGSVLVHTVVTAVGGEVRVDDREAGGSVVTLTVPCAGRPPVVTAADAEDV